MPLKLPVKAVNENAALEAVGREIYDGSATLVPACPHVGWSRFERASRSLESHVHPACYEICYLVSGTVEWWVGDQVYKVQPRDIFLTRPGENHGGLDAFMHPCELYWFHVKPRTQLARQLNGLQHRLFPGAPSIAVHLQTLMQEQRLAAKVGADPLGKAAAGAAFCLLLVEVLRCHEQALATGSVPCPPSPATRAAQITIQKLYGDHNCLRHAAHAAGLAGTQFRRRFQAETGYSPHQYLVQVQIQEAKGRLTTTNHSITQIAFDLGFSTSQYFATAFRKVTGLSPQQYRAIRQGKQVGPG